MTVERLERASTDKPPPLNNLNIKGENLFNAIFKMSGTFLARFQCIVNNIINGGQILDIFV